LPSLRGSILNVETAPRTMPDWTVPPPPDVKTWGCKSGVEGAMGGVLTIVDMLVTLYQSDLDVIMQRRA